MPCRGRLCPPLPRKAQASAFLPRSQGCSLVSQVPVGGAARPLELQSRMACTAATDQVGRCRAVASACPTDSLRPLPVRRSWGDAHCLGVTTLLQAQTKAALSDVSFSPQLPRCSQ